MPDRTCLRSVHSERVSSGSAADVTAAVAGPGET